MKKYFTVALALLALSGLSIAGDNHEGAREIGNQAQTVTLTGQIIDPVCFLEHGASGPDHRTCAQACAKMGINLVFFNDQDRQIYNIIPTGHADPNDKVIDFAEKHVEIVGTLHQTAGYQAIEIQTIKELGEGQKITLNE